MIEGLNYKAMNIALLKEMKAQIEEEITRKLEESTNQEKEDIAQLFSQGVTIPETNTTYSMQKVIEIAVETGLLCVYDEESGAWEKDDYNSIWTDTDTHVVMLDITP